MRRTDVAHADPCFHAKRSAAAAILARYHPSIFRITNPSRSNNLLIWGSRDEESTCFVKVVVAQSSDFFFHRKKLSRLWIRISHSRTYNARTFRAHEGYACRDQGPIGTFEASVLICHQRYDAIVLLKKVVEREISLRQIKT